MASKTETPAAATTDEQDKKPPFLAGKRKLILVALGLAGVITIGIVKDVPPQEIIEQIKWLIGIGVGGFALEDGLKGMRKPA